MPSTNITFGRRVSAFSLIRGSDGHGDGDWDLVMVMVIGVMVMTETKRNNGPPAPRNPQADCCFLCLRAYTMFNRKVSLRLE